MSRFVIRKVAVLGAGVMGAQIAAHCANAGLPVVLFDLPASQGRRNGIVERAIANLKKMNPAPLAYAELAEDIQPANYEDHLPLLEDCDLVIEAIAERMDWKHDLYRTVAQSIAPHAIFATNTSGLSIARLADGLDAELRERFCGMHFFNPPRYMPLVELIPTEDTRAELLDALETFLTTTLGKSVVRAKDMPNFVGNRVGIFSILATIIEAEKYGLPYDVVDALTGERMGRAKSGTFRTADVVGLDTMAHVIRTMQENLPHDPFAAHFATPAVLVGLLERGALGQKTGAGFYRKQGKSILRLDPASDQYVPSSGKADDIVTRILKITDPGERLQKLRASSNPQAQFVWAILRDLFHYVAVHLGDIAHTAADVDLALRWGFGQEQGAFELWQQAGWLKVAGWITEDIEAGKALADVPLPAWVTTGDVAACGGVYGEEGSWNAREGRFEQRPPLPVYRRQVFPEVPGQDAVRLASTAGNTVFEDESIRLWTLAETGRDDVLLASFKTKMHTIGPGVVAGLMQALDLAERDYRGLVIWQTSGAFSAGADLQAMMPVFMSGGPAAIGVEQKKLQDAMLRLRYAQVPVVSAIAGLALGAGCELALYSARRVAALESYIGLVEVGVGLVPGGGGLTYGARAAAEANELAPDAPLLQFLKRYVMQAATAQVSKSALEAQRMGYLQLADVVVLHPRELLHVAVSQARAMADAGYRPPRRRPFPVVGSDGLATITAQLVNMRDGGFVSAHDFHLARSIAEVMCGGDVDPGSYVDEPWLMALERKTFTSLLNHPKTQERVMGMLQTGKPVRN